MANAADVQRLYDHAAARYDAVTSARRLNDLRSVLLADARGDVLELAVGTGATFVHYPPTLRHLTAQPVPPRLAAWRVARLPV